jgi:hypothetical protein
MTASDWETRLGPNIHRLSGASQNFIKLAKHWQTLKALAATSADETVTVPMSIAPQSQMPVTGESRYGSAVAVRNAVPASQPNLSFTRFSGAVQSETSTAWCGKNAVVAFNDSGSFWETAAGKAGTSLVGYALSNDRGKNFTDQGFPQVGPALTEMLGDPVVACGDPNTFFYSTLYQDSSASGPSGAGLSGVSLSVSTNAGQTFSAPVPAVEKDFLFHLIDRDWMAVDSANPKHVFITYTDFDQSNNGSTGNKCGSAGSGIPRTAIELVSSVDGGITWSWPAVVVEVCGSTTYVEGSQVVVDPGNGAVYVAWELFGKNVTTREIDIAKSTDGGSTFSARHRIHKVQPVGGAGLFVPSLSYYLDLEGAIRDSEFPSLTVAKGPNAGNLYVTWNDGDRRIGDALVSQFRSIAFDGKYGFSDVFFSSSTNGGSSWSSPVIVNTPASSSSPGDHFQPGIAVDESGTIAICWYDRGQDANNILIQRSCGTSTDGGLTWNNLLLTRKYPSVTSQDAIIAINYQGDYDQLASNVINQGLGFLDGFVNTRAGNQNVQVNKFSASERHGVSTPKLEFSRARLTRQKTAEGTRFARSCFSLVFVGISHPTGGA